MAAPKKTKEEPWWPGEDSNKVLVPKVGKEKQFKETLENINQIANGKLGWKGHAEMYVDMGLESHFGMKPAKNREAGIEVMIKKLQEAFCSGLVEFGEWLTPEQVEQRKRAITALYGKTDKESL